MIRIGDERLRAELRGLLQWSGRAVVAGAVVALFDLGFTAALFPAAVTYPAGGVLTFLQLAALYTAWSLPLSWLLALVDGPRTRKALPTTGSAFAAVALGGTGAAVFAVADSSVDMSDLEFVGEVVAMKWLLVGLVVFSGCLAYPRARGLVERALEYHPRLERGVVAAGWGAIALGLVSVAHRAFASTYQFGSAAVVTIAASAAVMLALRAVRPQPSGREAFGALGGYLLALAAALFFPGPARDHARFVVFVRGAASNVLATKLRHIVDRDGDGSAPAWAGGTDCDEGNPAVGPGVIEVPGDGVDQDCRGGDAAPPTTPLPLASGPPDCQPVVSRPSILWIVVDSLRGQAIGPDTTPALLQLARNAQVFARAYSPTSTTETSFPSMMAGRALSDTGVANPIVEGRFDIAATFPERFRDAGYATAMLSELDCNPVCRRGFQTVNAFWRDAWVPNVKHVLTTVSYARGVLDILRSATTPTLILMHLADVHAPYKASLGSSGALGEADAYLEGVAYVDRKLGQLFTMMQEQGLLAKTVIAVTADHGEELMQRGRHGHGANLFEEGTHVPLILWVPGCAGRIYRAPVSVARLGPTLGALTGVSVPGLGLFTETELPAMSEGANRSTMHFQRATMQGHYKLIVDVANGGRMLFDLQADPLESRNILAEDPATAASMEQAYQRWLDSPTRR